MNRMLAPIVGRTVRALAACFGLALLAAAPVAVYADEFAPENGFSVRLCDRESAFSMTLFTGEYASAMTGSLTFAFDDSAPVKRMTDAEVPVVLTTAALRFATPLGYAPQTKCTGLVLSKRDASMGTFNTETGEIWISAHFTTARGNLPVAMPIELVGTLADGYLTLSASSGMIDAGVEMRIEGGVVSGGGSMPSIGEYPLPALDGPVCRAMIETGE